MTMNWQSDSEFYEHFGRFCVDFEQLCRSMESCIRIILHKEGLANSSVHEVLLSGYTAEPLRALLQNLVGETLANTNKERALCSKVFSRIQKLIDERNDLLHGKWFLFYSDLKDQEKEILALGEKLHANKKGAATKVLRIEKSKLDELVNSCREAAITISLIIRCIIGLRTLNDCFQIENKEFSINHEALEPVRIKV
jgi:hypothetical protein